MPVGVLAKMPAQLINDKAYYQLKVGNECIDLNNRLGQTISLEYQNAIYCLNCGTLTNKSYSQGYCYPCSQSLACCDLCIFKPETCHYEKGTCREPDWGLKNCFSSHIVYLANSSGIKVGITRHSPTRFIDQGAVSALPILAIDNRFKSGQLEVQFKQFIADKTNWRKMLKNEVEYVDLIAYRDKLLPKINLLDAIPIQSEIIDIKYPVLEYPKKVVSLNFDKTTHIQGTLLGVKGQYLILDTGVLNIRKFTSYSVRVI